MNEVKLTDEPHNWDQTLKKFFSQMLTIMKWNLYSFIITSDLEFKNSWRSYPAFPSYSWFSGCEKELADVIHCR